MKKIVRGEGGERKVIMSRKKAVKGKGSSRSPKGSPSSGKDGVRTGKGLAAAAAPSSGLVYPSRPSLSNSGEFYDIAFKVSRRHTLKPISEPIKRQSHVAEHLRSAEVRTPETEEFPTNH